MADFCRECGKTMPLGHLAHICDKCVRARDERERLDDLQHDCAAGCVVMCQVLVAAAILLALVTAAIQWVKFSWNL